MADRQTDTGKTEEPVRPSSIPRPPVPGQPVHPAYGFAAPHPEPGPMPDPEIASSEGAAPAPPFPGYYYAPFPGYPGYPPYQVQVCGAYGALPYAGYPPYVYPGHPDRRTEPSALMALVLTVPSLVVLPALYPAFVKVGVAAGVLLPALVAAVIPSIVALVVAGGAQRSIRASHGWLGGRRLTTTAKVLAYVTIALDVLAAAVIVLWITGLF